MASPAVAAAAEGALPGGAHATAMGGVKESPTATATTATPTAATATATPTARTAGDPTPLPPAAATAEEDIFGFVRRHSAGHADGFDKQLYLQLLGSANPFKEGDAFHSVGTTDEGVRGTARQLLLNTTIGDLVDHPPYVDEVYRFGMASVDERVLTPLRGRPMRWLRGLLLDGDEAAIRAVMPGLPSDVIAVLVRLCSNAELVAISRKVFNPAEGTKVGAKGYFGARIQPNSPTDCPEDIFWQVLNGFAFAVGDVVLGNNPVDSRDSVIRNTEACLYDILDVFGLVDTCPHCCLTHIDSQVRLARTMGAETGLWFQSLAGTDGANQTFNISVAKVTDYARLAAGDFAFRRASPYAFYFETGQGADFTNGHGEGFDMVCHEARKYGFARGVAHTLRDTFPDAPKQLIVNDVSGFIGPEVFQSREQLVRVCLEDTLMGKLHGLTMGLDICATMHMGLELDDLEWCIDQILPANPAYMMALPTRNDPMLSYLTTSFQDHVRVRSKFGFKVNDAMWAFFQRIGVIRPDGTPTEHFGDPSWVYYQYQLHKAAAAAASSPHGAGAIPTEGELAFDAGFKAKAAEAMARVEARGVFLARGHGEQAHDMNPETDARIRKIVAHAKQVLWHTLSDGFVAQFPGAIRAETRSIDRRDYIQKPTTGESLASLAPLAAVRPSPGRGDHTGSGEASLPAVLVVVSDGLNADAIEAEGHVATLLSALEAHVDVSPSVVFVRNGRVRAGYQIGQHLFGAGGGQGQGEQVGAAVHALVHLIGERPGCGHNNFSAYVTACRRDKWRAGVDHDVTQVVSGISHTSTPPAQAAAIIATLIRGSAGWPQQAAAAPPPRRDEHKRPAESSAAPGADSKRRRANIAAAP